MATFRQDDLITGIEVSRDALMADAATARMLSTALLRDEPNELCTPLAAVCKSPVALLTETRSPCAAP
jgi:hypothetical protein